MEAVAEAGDDSEWRKRVTAALVESPTFLLLDNTNNRTSTPVPWPLRSPAGSGRIAASASARWWRYP